jgi:ferrous iron transport protein B
MLSMYLLGIVAAAGTAWFFKRSMLKGPKAAFILEMPTYKLPQLSQIVRHVVTNTWQFIAKAGTVIFCFSVILWALAYYPRLRTNDATTIHENSQLKQIRASVSEWESLANGGVIPSSNLPETLAQKAILESSVGVGEKLARLRPRWNDFAWDQVSKRADEAVAAEQLRYSLAGRFGHAIEPAIKPLGYDWKMGVGLVGAFAAREVFVSTMGIVYSVGDTEEAGTGDLSSAMRNDRYANGKPVWTPVVAISLLVWFVLAMQCMSTLAIVRRETGGWKWPMAMLIYMNVLAYVLSLAVYQVGSRIWQ